ncbi:arsenic resistance protein [Kineococcus sp. R86509]|uniref:arsenic resistance protein n=1 Tax=Kineococcus sp. R86509 TaxID=3093851 RepID=UPI0036D20CBD
MAWLERHQIALYLAAIAAAAVLGVLIGGAHHLEVAIEPVLGLLLYATFLAVPFTALGRALRDGRFLAAVGVLNFVVVPLVAFGLSRLVADDPALLFGVLLVLLCPCIDYVIVFAGLAGGAADRLLAAAPLLMLAQILLLPLYLLLFIGPAGVAVVEVGPFAEAFVVLIVVPLTAAALTQRLAARAGRTAHVAGAVQAVTGAAMVPLMMATLFVVVASQAGAVSRRVGELLVLVPLYAGFLIVMAVLGAVAARAFRLDVASGRTLVFSGATRNSLVVLPLALALPASLSLAPVVVVTQTLVELIGMVVYVRLVPRLIGVGSKSTFS